ncbi:MAG TPA: hypothetical protein VM581_04100 [Magnetospirillaceae bacterium]|nr:hypothetical protein [Magnetospirillaceae bacterium]
MPQTRRNIFQNLSYACLSLLAFLAIFSNSLLNAQSAAAIAQGFQTSETNLTPGALMSLKPGSNNSVELANTDRLQRLVGVIGEDSLVELSNADDTTLVVTSGVTMTLVSDANGAISSGDKITASPIDGIGMKATTSAQVVGTAQASLSSATTQTRTVTTTDGSEVQIHIGLIPVQVNVTFYLAPTQNSFLPTFLQDFANSVSGKEVSPVRVMIAALIVLLAFISIAVLLYSTVKSSIISIGRNPLSEKAVQKGIFQIGITVLGILLLTLITIYLILTT